MSVISFCHPTACLFSKVVMEKKKFLPILGGSCRKWGTIKPPPPFCTYCRFQKMKDAIQKLTCRLHLLRPRILRIAREDSSSGMRTRKLVTGAMVRPVGYDVHSVHTAMIINIARSGNLMNWRLVYV